MSNNRTSYPFYAHPMGYKRSIQIIKETKAEIKKMESHRPSTPFGRKNIEKEHCLPTTSRPTSSSSLKSLNYEHEEDIYLSSRKVHPLSLSALKGKVTNPKDLKLEPLVTKSVLTTRKSISSLGKSHSQQEITFPPIAYDEKIKDCMKNIGSSIKSEVSLQTIDHFQVDCHNNIISADAEIFNQEINSSYFASSLNAEQTSNEDRNSDELSQELKRIMFALDKNLKIGTKKCEEDHIITVSKLYNMLKEKNAFQTMHCHRIPLLKLLFKLLDSNLPVLSLHTIKLLLEMKVKDKNLGTVFRLISKLMTNKQVNLEGYHLVEPLIEAVQETSFQNNKETLLYGVNVLKSLIFRNAIQEQHLEITAVVLMYHLSQFNNMIPSPEERCDDTYIDLNKQIFAALHCLAENDDVWKFLSSLHNLSEILKGLSFFYQNTDITQIIVRLISKIIDKENGCQSLAQCPEKLVMEFSLILQTHRYNIDISMQTTFIIGNLVLVDKKIAETFLNVYNLHDVLIQILEEYVKEHIQPKKTISELFKLSQGDSSGDHNWRHEVFEVISRILCILANICLNAEAGYFLAQENDTIMHLLNIIAVYLKQETLTDASLPIYSFLVVIGNISYYLSPDSESSFRIAKRVIPLLDDKFSLEVRRESANIVQNLTRFPEVRKYIEDYSLVPAFIKLLSADDKEFNIVAYGIIMNLLLDKNNHQIFYKEQGVTRIIHKLHMCTERDWKTSSMLCQILWNYCKCLSENVVPISNIEAQHLIKYLSYSTNQNNNLEEENCDNYFTWKNEFCPVAKKLLSLLQSKTSSVT